MGYTIMLVLGIVFLCQVLGESHESGSEENTRPPCHCPSHLYKCTLTSSENCTCIPRDWLCDENNDCEEADDESDCSSGVSWRFFISTPGGAIPVFICLCCCILTRRRKRPIRNGHRAAVASAVTSGVPSSHGYDNRSFLVIDPQTLGRDSTGPPGGACIHPALPPSYDEAVQNSTDQPPSYGDVTKK